MGICASCLGWNRSPSEEADSSRLLFDDPNTVNYGSFGDHHQGPLQTDPQDVQRESEALQKVVAQTSNHLVDIFSVVPPELQRSPGANFSTQDTRLQQYHELLSKLPGDVASDEPQGAAPQTHDWPSDDEEEDEAVKSFRVVKSKGSARLLGGFAEVENSTA